MLLANDYQESCTCASGVGNTSLFLLRRFIILLFSVHELGKSGVTEYDAQNCHLHSYHAYAKYKMQSCSHRRKPSLSLFSFVQ